MVLHAFPHAYAAGITGRHGDVLAGNEAKARAGKRFLRKLG
jgi:hypothetical protein